MVRGAEKITSAEALQMAPTKNLTETTLRSFGRLMPLDLEDFERHCAALLNKVALECGIVILPERAVLPTQKKPLLSYLGAHVFLPSPYVVDEYINADDQCIKIEKNRLSALRGWDERRTATIVSEETCFRGKQGQKFLALVVDIPLLGPIGKSPVTWEKYQHVPTLDEATRFLFSLPAFTDALSVGTEGISALNHAEDSGSMEIDRIVETANSLISDMCNMCWSDENLPIPQYLTYSTHCFVYSGIFDSLFRKICASRSGEEAILQAELVRSRDRCTGSTTVLDLVGTRDKSPMKQLHLLSTFRTPLEKLDCISTIVDSILLDQNELNIARKVGITSSPLVDSSEMSDGLAGHGLLQAVVHLLEYSTSLPYILANLDFIMLGQPVFGSSSQQEYYFTVYHAAIMHILQRANDYERNQQQNKIENRKSKSFSILDYYETSSLPPGPSEGEEKEREKEKENKGEGCLHPNMQADDNIPKNGISLSFVGSSPQDSDAASAPTNQMSLLPPRLMRLDVDDDGEQINGVDGGMGILDSIDGF